MQAKLELMSVEAFIKLKTAVDEVFRRRQRSMLYPGALASFTSRDGARLIMKIEKINPKSIGGYIVDEYGVMTSGRKSSWKVGPTLLTPFIKKEVQAKPPPPPTGFGKDKPTSAVASW